MAFPIFNKAKMEQLILKDSFGQILFEGLKADSRRDRLEAVFK